jgi:hypothetical protein
VVGRQGAPSAARLADGSFAVAWRDDIAGRDQCLLRRISADGRTVGPVVVLHERTESFADARAEPRLAALGTGLLGAWVDLRRGRGPDVFARLLGPQFDRRDTAAR